jgi:enoyl-CoA hydratase/carnithine racemase
MLRIERPAEGVVLAIFDRPDSLNAITMELQAEFDHVLTELEDDGETRCLVLTGAGDRAFSAGYDVHEMAGWSQDELAANLERRERWLWRFAQARVPVIAAVHGTTFGAGALYAAAADVRIGAQDTEFRFTAAAYNGANATWSLPRLVGHGVAAELLLSARRVGADEALSTGLLNHIGDVDRAVDLAAQIAANPPGGTRGVKQLLNRGLKDPFDAESEMMRTGLAPQPMQLPTLPSR